MASLRDTVKDYQEELRDGIAWVAFWKTGRSWNAEDFHLELGDYLYPEDRSRMEEIKQADPAAVVVNGYYSGYLGVVVKHFCNTLFENSPGISSFKWCFPIIVGMRTDMIVPYVHISV